MNYLYRNPEDYKGIFNAINTFWMEGNTIAAILLSFVAIVFILLASIGLVMCARLTYEVIIQYGVGKRIEKEIGKEYSGRIGTEKNRTKK